MKKHWLATATIALVLVPQMVFAQAVDPNENKFRFPDQLGTNIPGLVQRVVQGALSLAGAIFFIMFLWGGVRYLTAGGSAEDVKKARQVLSNSVIGMVIVALSYILTYNVINALTNAVKK